MGIWDTVSQWIKPIGDVAQAGSQLYSIYEQQKGQQNAIDTVREAELAALKYQQDLDAYKLAMRGGGGGGGGGGGARITPEIVEMYKANMANAFNTLKPYQQAGETILPEMGNAYRSAMAGAGNMFSGLNSQESFNRMNASTQAYAVDIPVPRKKNG